MFNEKYEFVKVPYQPISEYRFKKYKPTTKVLYLTFCRLAHDFANKETGWFFHSLESLCEASGLKRRTVIEAKKILIKDDLIECKRGFRHNSHYRSSDCYKINGIRSSK